MNILAYIESGILERFIMGETNEAESLEVISMAKKYPEIQIELDAIEETLLGLAEAGAVEAKSSTKANLMDSLFNNTNETKQVALNQSLDETKVIPLTVKSNRNIWLMAASLALLVSLGINFLLYTELDKSERAYFALSTEKQELASNNKIMEANYTELNKQWETIISESVIQIKLKGINVQPEALATVYYNTKNKDVFVHLNQLKEAPEGKQFQLWAIIDGTPVDAGVFDANSKEALIQLKSSDKPAVFAVTIENKGGSAVPSLDQMVLIGNVQS